MLARVWVSVEGNVGWEAQGTDKKEAYQLVRRGLKADLKSHMCWHVHGRVWEEGGVSGGGSVGECG